MISSLVTCSLPSEKVLGFTRINKLLPGHYCVKIKSNTEDSIINTLSIYFFKSKLTYASKPTEKLLDGCLKENRRMSKIFKNSAKSCSNSLTILLCDTKLLRNSK